MYLEDLFEMIPPVSVDYEKQIKERAMSKKSELVRGFGLAMSIGAALDEIRRAQGVSEEEFHILGTSEGHPHLEKMIIGLKKPVIAQAPAYPIYPIEVDYGMSLSQMIVAGQYGYVNDAITPERFSIVGNGKQLVEIALVHFGRAITSQVAIDEMDKEGYRPAIIAELLALGATHPELQRQFPVIALGSVAEVDGIRRVAYLDDWLDRRGLDLGWFAIEWVDRCRFAFVRKN